MTKGYWTGKRRSEKTKEKIRKTLKKIYSDPTKHPQYKGRIDRSGYLYIKKPKHPNSGKQGYVAVHHLVIEKHFGRFLKKSEIVHHKNGDRKDNRIKNLKICESSGKHTAKYHQEIYKKQSKLFKGKRFSPNTEFQKGRIPWNKKT